MVRAKSIRSPAGSVRSPAPFMTIGRDLRRFLLDACRWSGITSDPFQHALPASS
jgi:hypothetical protein